MSGGLQLPNEYRPSNWPVIGSFIAPLWNIIVVSLIGVLSYISKGFRGRFRKALELDVGTTPKYKLFIFSSMARMEAI